MLRWLSYLVFQLQLLLGIFSFALAVLWALTIKTVKKRQSFLSILLTFSLLVSLFLITYSALQSQENARVLKVPQQTDAMSLPTQSMTYEQAQQTYAVTRALLEMQPNHRDTLINAALLAEQLNLPGEAQHYWLEAQHLDPNAPIFNNE